MRRCARDAPSVLRQFSVSPCQGCSIDPDRTRPLAHTHRCAPAVRPCALCVHAASAMPAEHERRHARRHVTVHLDGYCPAKGHSRTCPSHRLGAAGSSLRKSVQREGRSCDDSATSFCNTAWITYRGTRGISHAARLFAHHRCTARSERGRWAVLGRAPIRRCDDPLDASIVRGGRTRADARVRRRGGSPAHRDDHAARASGFFGRPSLLPSHGDPYGLVDYSYDAAPLVSVQLSQRFRTRDEWRQAVSRALRSIFDSGADDCDVVREDGDGSAVFAIAAASARPLNDSAMVRTVLTGVSEVGGDAIHRAYVVDEPADRAASRIATAHGKCRELVAALRRAYSLP